MLFSDVLGPDLTARPKPITAESTLCAVRRANLYGRLYVSSSSAARLQALEALSSAGLVERVQSTATAVGGWFVLPDARWL